MSDAGARRGLFFVLLVQSALALTFAWLTPAWEAPDEPWHLGYVTWLKTEQRLPPPTVDMLETWVNQEASQPPLYYVLAAIASAPFSTSDMDTAFVENPGRWGGVGLEARNHNYALHGPWDAPFGSPLMRGLLAARLIAALMAVVADWATYQLDATIVPHRLDVALAAAAVLAFTPQFAFLSGAASNDTTAAAACTVALWRAAVLLRAPGDRNALLCGLALGAALLTKSSALALVPIVALAALSTGLTAPLRSALRLGAIVLAAAGLVGGWWYARNLLGYGTFIGSELHLAMPWAREVPADLAKLVEDGEPWLLFLSYWAAFGWGTIRWPDPVYRVVFAVCLLAGMGLVYGGWRSIRSGWMQADSQGLLTRAAAWLRDPRVRTVLMLAAFAVAVLVALVGWMQVVRAHWGRLLFPAAGSISVLLALGLHAVLPRARLALLAATALAMWSISAPSSAIRPALLPPTTLSAQQTETLPDPVGWRIGDVAELLSVRPETSRVSVDSAWRVAVCWRPLRRTPKDVHVLVHLVGPDDALVASYHSVPADGNASTRAWEPGAAFCETVDVQIGEDVRAPAVYDVAVGLFDPATLDRLPATDTAGNAVGAGFVTRVKVEPDALGWTQRPIEAGLTVFDDPPGLDMTPLRATCADDRGGNDVGARRGARGVVERSETAEGCDDAITLVGYALPEGPVCAGSEIEVRLLWRAGNAAPPLDLQVLLHLRRWPGAPAAPLAQADGSVHDANGAPYPTSLWSPFEQVLDRRTLTLDGALAPGAYALVTGMYRLSDGVRADVVVDAESPVLDAVRLPATVEIASCESGRNRTGTAGGRAGAFPLLEPRSSLVSGLQPVSTRPNSASASAAAVAGRKP